MGADIAFTLRDSVDRLEAEIERFEQDTGGLVAWVRLPSVDSATAVQLHVYFNNPAAALVPDRAALWSGTRGVFHLEDLTDSSAMAVATTEGGTLSLADGAAGGARTFSGADYLELEDDTYDFGMESFSWTAWVRTGPLPGSFARVVDKGIPIQATDGPGYAMIYSQNEQDMYLSDTSVFLTASLAPPVINRFVFLASVVDRENEELRSYIDGTLTATTLARRLRLARQLDASANRRRFHQRLDPLGVLSGSSTRFAVTTTRSIQTGSSSRNYALRNAAFLTSGSVEDR